MQNDFLSSLSLRSMQSAEANPPPGLLQPRLASRYEPSAGAGPLAQSGADEEPQPAGPTLESRARNAEPAAQPGRTQSPPPADRPEETRPRLSRPSLDEQPPARAAEPAPGLSAPAILERLVVEHHETLLRSGPPPQPETSPQPPRPVLIPAPAPGPQDPPAARSGVTPAQIIVTRHEQAPAQPGALSRLEPVRPAPAPKPQASLPPAEAQPPSIHVTIGRIEVKAGSPAASPAKRPPAAPGAMSLDEYLRQRQGGSR